MSETQSRSPVPAHSGSYDDRNPKRRRTDNGYTTSPSPAPSSGDELAANSPLPTDSPALSVRATTKPSNGNLRKYASDVRVVNGHAGSHGERSREEDSPDELDHTFLRVRGEDFPRRRHVSMEASETQDSDVDMMSSQIQSPAPLQYPPEVRYRQKLILRGHKRGIAMVKFSPDGRWVASASADATCRIWDATTGRHQRTLEGHLAGVSTIAWSPDSRTLASGSDDKSIRLWDAITGKPHATPLLGHHSYVYSVAFSPKGNMLISGSYDEAVFLWDVRNARLMRSLPAHSDPVGGVDFVRDGTLVVSCSSDGLIRVWDTATGQCLRTFFHEDTPPVVSVRFSPNGKYILAWMLDSCLRMWNYVDGRCVKTYQGHKNEKYSLGGAFGVYGDVHSAFVVSGSEDGCIFLWDVVSKAVLQRMEGHSGAVLGVDVHPVQQKIVSCGLDKTIRIWEDERNDSYD